MERFFNTAGPNRPKEQYTIDPLSRLDLDDVLMLIRQKKYFVLHAPRQTGKTSCMLALRDYLNQHGDTVIKDGLRQTYEYMDTVGSVDEGHLIIFDCSKEKSREERIWHKPCQYNEKNIIVWGM